MFPLPRAPSVKYYLTTGHVGNRANQQQAGTPETRSQRESSFPAISADVVVSSDRKLTNTEHKDRGPSPDVFPSPTQMLFMSLEEI